jgi:hypothetical protein
VTVAHHRSSAPSGFLLLIVLAGGGFLFLRLRRRRQVQKAQLEEVRKHAREDLIALGDDIRALDLDVEMPNVNAAAKSDYGDAVNAYKSADEALTAAQRTQDLAHVTEMLEQGRYAMTSARARLDGHEPPERRPPCFFDPRHGPSVRDVEWAPPGGTVRAVPACAADAQLVEGGQDPRARMITVDGRSTPYWNAPAYYGPWAGGYFGSFGGGLFAGMLAGGLLGGAFGYGLGEDMAYGDAGGGGGGDF